MPDDVDGYYVWVHHQSVEPRTIMFECIFVYTPVILSLSLSLSLSLYIYICVCVCVCVRVRACVCYTKATSKNGIFTWAGVAPPKFLFKTSLADIKNNYRK